MACLNLTNGWFIPTSWITAPSTNLGVTTVTRTPTSISVQRSGQTGSVLLSGDFLYAVFGDLNFVALLHRNVGAGTITWTVSMVDTTGASISSNLLFSVNLPSSQQPPHLEISPGNGRLAFFWSGTGTANEVFNMMIVRSDDQSIALAGPGTISNLNSNMAAQITATQLIIHHPNTGSNDDTAGPRPAGSLTITPDPADFGEAVIGASDPALGTVTVTFTLGNNGSDCITVTGIGNDPPFTVAPASLALLPIELDPGETATIDVIFAPLTPGNNISGSLPVTRNPANGDSSLEAEGDARNAEAEISLSRSSINFGTIPHPGTDTENFSITNSGDLDVNVSIPGPPGGSAFNWATVGTLNLPVSGPSITMSIVFTTPGDFAATPVTLTITPSAGSSRSITFNGAGCIPNAVAVVPPAAPINFGQIERGFRTVRFKVVQNTGDGDLVFTARITAGAVPAHAALFGLVLPDSDITDAPAVRTYTVFPTVRCGPGPEGDGTVPVAVSFYAGDTASTTPYTAQLEIDDPVTATTTTYALSATITPAIPLDAVLVFDRSGSMDDAVGARTKIEAAQSAGRLFVQMLRPDAEDRAAIISFNKDPTDDFPIAPVAGNVAAMQAALGFTADGATNIAGGVIIGQEEYSDPTHPSSPPDLKKAMVVLTDGMDNRCFQIGGAGDWYSITGRAATDPPDGMFRPDLTPQDSEVLPAPTGGIQVYAIGLGRPEDVDGAALDALSSATGVSYDNVVDLTGDDFFLLEKHFTQIFMEAVGLAVITDPFYTIVPGDKHEHAFNVWPGDVSAMVVIYDHPDGRLPIFLISPAGEQISGASLPPGFGVRFRSTPTARFIEVKFPQGEPERYDGLWQVVVVHEGRICRGDINPPDRQDKEHKDDPTGGNSQDVGRGFLPKDCRDTKDPVDYGIAIGVGSNLRMQAYVEPGTKFVGDTIRLNGILAEAGLPLLGSNVRVFAESPSGAEYTIILRDDGLHQDGDEDDGDYGGLFTKTTETGLYRFLFHAEGQQAGRSYVRELHRSKTIYDRRKPPTVGRPGDDDCCERLIRLLKTRDQSTIKKRK
ncbi:MAG: VWA domain-containing protein [Alphaproteobacteria bacterium]|nr:VWA domain-containing protein [Alphaproteobacteria bacterium]